MTPDIMKFLISEHKILTEDVFTVVEVPGFLGVTLHRDNGITEIIRYKTNIYNSEEIQDLINPRKLTKEVKDNIILHLVANEALFTAYAAARLMSCNTDYVKSVMRLGNKFEPQILITHVDPNIDFSHFQHEYQLDFINKNKQTTIDD